MTIVKTTGTPVAYVLTDPDGLGPLPAVVPMTYFFAIPAVLTGWVLQAIIVAIKNRRKNGAGIAQNE